MEMSIFSNFKKKDINTVNNIKKPYKILFLLNAKFSINHIIRANYFINVYS